MDLTIPAPVLTASVAELIMTIVSEVVSLLQSGVMCRRLTAAHRQVFGGGWGLAIKQPVLHFTDEEK